MSGATAFDGSPGRGSDRTEGEARVSALGRVLDFASDWTLLAYAVWTLIAFAGMLAGTRVSVLVAVWLATVPVVGVALSLTHRRWTRQPDDRAPVDEAPARASRVLGRRPLVVLAVSTAAAVTSGIVAAAAPDRFWLLAWLTGVVAAALAVLTVYVWRIAPARSDRQRSWDRRCGGAFGDISAALAGLGFAILSLFVHRASADDVFYVNRATATAELNRIPVRDVLLTQEQAPPASGVGLPVDTFSALEGALGRVVDVHAASVAYYVAPPLFTFLATWALWRLLRAWQPRAALLCFAVGCLYLLFSDPSGKTAGAFFLPKMWQGKVVFVAWLVPTLYVFLTRWLDRRDILTAILLVAGGIASIGMTGSAAFVVPLMIVAAGLPLVLSREWRSLPLLAAVAVFPFAVGTLVTRQFPLVDRLAEPPPTSGIVDLLVSSTSHHLHSVFGVGVVAALGLIALWLSPFLAEARAAARVAAGIAVVAALVLAPGVIAFLSHAAGLWTVVWRTLWVVPIPAVVGLLAVLPIPWLRWRYAAALPALVVAGLLLAFGQPLWRSDSGKLLLESRPYWKRNQAALTDARSVLRKYTGAGPILADKQTMANIAVLTVHPKAVTPRVWYTLLTLERGGRTQARVRLNAFVTNGKPYAAPEDLRGDLDTLDVGLVCVDRRKTGVLDQVEEAGPYRKAFETRRHVCLEREETSPVEAS